MRSTRFLSPSATRASISKRRFRLFVFLVRMWRACEWPRLILPVAVRRKRFAAPLCVFSFGIIASFQISNLRSQISNPVAEYDRCHPGWFSPEETGSTGVAGAAAAVGAAGAAGAAGVAGDAGVEGVAGAGLFW